MNISLNSTYMVMGEHNARQLTVSVMDNLRTEKTVYLAIKTPSGNCYLTEPLTFDEKTQTAYYTIPNTLEAESGILQAQIVISGANGFCLKSAIFEFDIYDAINVGTQQTLDESSFLSLTSVSAENQILQSRLSDVEADMEDLTALTEQEILEITT